MPGRRHLWRHLPAPVNTYTCTWNLYQRCLFLCLCYLAFKCKHENWFQSLTSISHKRGYCEHDLLSYRSGHWCSVGGWTRLNLYLIKKPTNYSMRCVHCTYFIETSQLINCPKFLSNWWEYHICKNTVLMTKPEPQKNILDYHRSRQSYEAN